ncbi:hypothetical protein K2173_015234 [Erythroxylum novogranatense]|uniref:C2H2-type domain-containing protein n=1 Tax=Erythroxylum novogranatense TaxID=1862640 RepID=A0AAV8T1C6_9ROSI|nr:hypothetical protein K2173_015234 [Erythroxylum novogranatense]
MLGHSTFDSPSPSADPLPSLRNSGVTNKRKRKPAGTPDPDAEVVTLSPRTLLESDRYVCEICNQGFQRDQNLQMHRRRHKVPWKLLKKETQEVKKRVYVCPEASCLHHDPCHALGDLVGIKKHFRRKHSNRKQWVCEKCSKAYAVQSDYKAHLKTCGTRGHSCDCGRVFSRVESFIEHQDACTVRPVQAEVQAIELIRSSRPASSPSSDANFSTAPLTEVPLPRQSEPVSLYPERNDTSTKSTKNEHNAELQFLPCEYYAANLNLSIGSSSNQLGENKSEMAGLERNIEQTVNAAKLKELANEQLRIAMAEKSYAEDARERAKRQIEIAELEFANAKRIRQKAQAEVEKAQVLREQARMKISSTIFQITCQACKQLFQASAHTPAAPADESSLATSYMSSAIIEGDEE